LTSRILVVDDEDSIARLLKRVLTRWGHHVEVATDGNAAVAHMQRSTYDILFLDLNMPGLHGQLVFDWIKANREEMVSSTVILTGDHLRPDIAGFLARERILHLAKPFQLAELSEIIAAIPKP